MAGNHHGLMINISILHILHRKFFLWNRIFVGLCVTAISVSVSHFGNGMEGFLHSKYAARYLGTEVDNVYFCWRGASKMPTVKPVCLCCRGGCFSGLWSWCFAWALNSLVSFSSEVQIGGIQVMNMERGQHWVSTAPAHMKTSNRSRDGHRADSWRHWRACHVLISVLEEGQALPASFPQ